MPGLLYGTGPSSLASTRWWSLRTIGRRPNRAGSFREPERVELCLLHPEMQADGPVLEAAQVGRVVPCQDRIGRVARKDGSVVEIPAPEPLAIRVAVAAAHGDADEPARGGAGVDPQLASGAEQGTGQHVAGPGGIERHEAVSPQGREAERAPVPGHPDV